MKACPHCSGTGVLDDSLEAEEAAMRADALDMGIHPIRRDFVRVADAARLCRKTEGHIYNLRGSRLSDEEIAGSAVNSFQELVRVFRRR